MKISLIVAMASNRVIGRNNQIPWHLSADLKKFKQITMGSPIVMGRKTFESIGKPLPGRSNIIISRNKSYEQPGCQVFSEIDQALASCADDDEVFIIGGSAMYEMMLPRAEIIYLTQIEQEFSGDTFFPEILASDWQIVEHQLVTDDKQAAFNYSFRKLKRIKN